LGKPIRRVLCHENDGEVLDDDPPLPNRKLCRTNSGWLDYLDHTNLQSIEHDTKHDQWHCA